MPRESDTRAMLAVRMDRDEAEDLDRLVDALAGTLGLRITRSQAIRFSVRSALRNYSAEDVRERGLL